MQSHVVKSVKSATAAREWILASVLASHRQLSSQKGTPQLNLPNMALQMLAPGEAQSARREVRAVESLTGPRGEG